MPYPVELVVHVTRCFRDYPDVLKAIEIGNGLGIAMLHQGEKLHGRACALRKAIQVLSKKQTSPTLEQALGAMREEVTILEEAKEKCRDILYWLMAISLDFPDIDDEGLVS